MTSMIALNTHDRVSPRTRLHGSLPTVMHPKIYVLLLHNHHNNNSLCPAVQLKFPCQVSFNLSHGEVFVEKDGACGTRFHVIHGQPCWWSEIRNLLLFIDFYKEMNRNLINQAKFSIDISFLLSKCHLCSFSYLTNVGIDVSDYPDTSVFPRSRSIFTV